MITGKLIVRPAASSDIGAILDVYSHYINNTTVTFEEEVPSAGQFRMRCEEIMTEYPFLVCQDGSHIAGYAYAHRHQSRSAYKYSAELSVYLRPHYTGLGIGRVLCEAIIELLKLQNVQTVYSAVSLPNDASCALHRSLGFEPAGLWRNTGRKKERWIDIQWFELVIGNYPEVPGEIIPFNRLNPAEVTGILRAAGDTLAQRKNRLSHRDT